MTKEEFITQMQQIETTEDDSQRRALFAKLSEDVSAVFDENQTLTETNQQNTERIQQLQKDNMDLFLQVGRGKSDDSDTEDPEDPDEPTITIKDLFDEKGMLK